MTTNFFHPSLLLLFLNPESGIRDPGSGMGKNQDPRSGINIPDPQHCTQLCDVNNTGDTLSPVSLLPTINYCRCRWHRQLRLVSDFHYFDDTGDEFIAGINDTGERRVLTGLDLPVVCFLIPNFWRIFYPFFSLPLSSFLAYFNPEEWERLTQTIINLRAGIYYAEQWELSPYTVTCIGTHVLAASWLVEQMLPFGFWPMVSVRQSDYFLIKWLSTFSWCV
jgi:hypothetical protein